MGSILADLAARTGHSQKTVAMHLRATAQLCLEWQVENLRRLCAYVWKMKQSEAIVPLLFVFHQSFDETPLKVGLRWQSGAASSEIGKIYLVVTKWTMLVRRKTVNTETGEADCADW